MSVFRRENYIQIPGFAVVDLKLSGNELICFSLIYGFSQDKETEFTGSLSYVSSALNVTRANAKAILDRLLAKGWIIKKEVMESGVKLCRYSINNGVIETITGAILNQEKGVIETITHNTKDNTKKDNDNTLFPVETITKHRGTTEPLCLFRNSKYYDLDAFTACFTEKQYEGIDILWYYHAVADWSAAGGKKKRDWIATARNFIRGDITKRKLHTTESAGMQLPESAINYLKMMDNG